MTLKEQWRAAMSEIRIAHIDPTCIPLIDVYGGDHDPHLLVAVRLARDTLDQERRIAQLTVSCVKLMFWPGTTLAQQWFAAAWSGYTQHEALELVTVAGLRPLDPHMAPYHYDRGLRSGFPPELTPETMRRTFTLVMSDEMAAKLVEGAN